MTTTTTADTLGASQSLRLLLYLPSLGFYAQKFEFKRVNRQNSKNRIICFS